MRPKRKEAAVMGMVYVLSLKTWSEYDRAHHWYGRIHWTAPYPCECNAGILSKGFDEVCTKCGADCSKSGQQSADAAMLPRDDGHEEIRHDTKDSVLEAARRWYATHAQPGSALVVGTWGLCGWESRHPYEVLEGKVTKALLATSADA